jgi:hypothetical protein
MSQETADLLIEANKQSWVEKRTDLVTAKGKGELQTYWVSRSGDGYAGSVASSADDSSTSIAMAMPPQISDAQRKDRELRLIQWNVKRFSVLLKEVAERRGDGNVIDLEDDTSLSTAGTATSRGLPFEEVKEVIDLSSTYNGLSQNDGLFNPDDSQLDPMVTTQLEEYISLIADMYEKHSFHK